jgi:hypothetical protein
MMSSRSVLPDDDSHDNATIIVNHQDDGRKGRRNSSNNTFLFQPLKIPGSYGRFDLLKPYIKVCPTCSRGCRRNNNLALKRICGPSSTPILCNICSSIQSMAKFIPRKEFWNFSYININTTTPPPILIDEQSLANKTSTTTTATVQLDIMGKEAMKLVRIISSSTIENPSTVERRINDDDNVQCVKLNEGDIVSLLWCTDSGQNDKADEEELVDYSSSNLEPLIQFQLVRINSDSSSSTTTTTDVPRMGNVVVAAAVAAAAAATARRDSFNDDDNSRTKDGAVIDKVSERDIPVEFSDNIHRDSNTNEHMYTTDQIEPIKNEIDDDTFCHGTSLESNTSSAPLSLPSRFVAEYNSLSYSFDSTTHQQQSPSSIQTRHTSLMKVDSSPQKSYVSTTTTSRKRTVINFNDDVDRTPKKSNITTSPNNNSNQYESIPISSLSYNQLVQLQQETIPPSNNLTNLPAPK